MLVGGNKFRVNTDSKHFLIDLGANEKAVKKVWSGEDKLTDDVWTHVLYKVSHEYYVILSHYVMHTTNVLIPVQEGSFNGVAMIKKEDLPLLSQYPYLDDCHVLKNAYEEKHLLNLKSRMWCGGGGFSNKALNSFVFSLDDSEKWFSDSGDAFFFKDSMHNREKLWNFMEEIIEELNGFKAEAYKKRFDMFKED